MGFLYLHSARIPADFNLADEKCQPLALSPCWCYHQQAETASN